MGLAKVSNQMAAEIKNTRSLFCGSSEEIINKHNGLVYSIAKKHEYLLRTFANRDLTFDDLMQRGRMGLLKAANKFVNRSRKASFKTYAAYWVESEIKGSKKHKPLSVSLDEPFEDKEGNDSSRYDKITAPHINMDREVLLKEIWAIIDSLPAKKKKMKLAMRMIFQDGRTFDDTGKKLGGLTRERIRQIQEEAIEIIKNKIKVKEGT